VTNNPTYCIEEVAEHTMALLLDSARKIAFYDRLVRAGTWAVPPGKPLYRLVGRTLGLVGFGNIARQVAVRAAAFGMNILYADPLGKEANYKGREKKADLGALNKPGVSFAPPPPLIPQTRGMINDDAFSKMKPGAIVINCSRGPVIDTAALVRALDSKK